MTGVRKNHTAQFKAKVALAAVKEQKTINELTSEFGIHATQLNLWKKQALEAVSNAFLTKKDKSQSNEHLIDELYKQIGQLTVEKEWLKKSLNTSV
jgi:transposase